MAETTAETTPVDEFEGNVEEYTSESEVVVEGDYTSESLPVASATPAGRRPGPSQERHRPRPDRSGHRQVEDQRSHP